MIRFLPIALLFIALMGCRPEPTSAPSSSASDATEQEASLDANDRTYVKGQRIGLIENGMTAADIRNLYGDDQLVAATLHGPEGITYPGFHLFPGTDDELNLTVDSMGITGETYNPGSHWTEANAGVRIGTSLEDLNRLNGRSFEFSGFDWDYGGYVNDWKGGKLEGLTLRLVYDNSVIYNDDKSFFDAVVGDQTVQSDNAELQGKGIRVTQLFMRTDK